MPTHIAILLIICAATYIIAAKMENKQLRLKLQQKVNYTELASQVHNMLQSNVDDVKIITFIREETAMGLVEAKKYVDNAKDAE
ncbi:hypothetical protein [Oceanobacillus locisalsi]|uniref:Ribosomal protein L7/L12 C-terminal domain-containing protein n=1 Tax=Oceanobacillus locisalsi TaxID=546107 RepID=A0ABW3NDA4_9BACI